MAYRTKYHNLIWNNYLNKVFDFIGLTTESSSGCSSIYGGLQGVYDFGPLGVELKKNLKEAWCKSRWYFTRPDDKTTEKDNENQS